jgi:azurin
MIRSILAIAALLTSFGVAAKTCELSIDGNDQMKYSVAELKIDADCTEVKLTLNHTGKLAKNVMGHNWVLTNTADVQALASDGMKAGAASDYLPADDARVLAHTKLIGGGESDTITFSTAGLTAGGDYSFFCSFPGHWAVMKGKFIFG